MFSYGLVNNALRASCESCRFISASDEQHQDNETRGVSLTINPLETSYFTEMIKKTIFERQSTTAHSKSYYTPSMFRTEIDVASLGF